MLFFLMEDMMKKLLLALLFGPIYIQASDNRLSITDSRSTLAAAARPTTSTAIHNDDRLDQDPSATRVRVRPGNIQRKQGLWAMIGDDITGLACAIPCGLSTLAAMAAKAAGMDSMADQLENFADSLDPEGSLPKNFTSTVTPQTPENDNSENN